MQKITATLIARTPEEAFLFEAKMLEAILELTGEYRLSCVYEPPIDSPEVEALTEKYLFGDAGDPVWKGHAYTTAHVSAAREQDEE